MTSGQKGNHIVRMHAISCIATAALCLLPATSFAQHEGHQPLGQAAAQAVGAAQIAACVDAQRQTSELVSQANARLETARQTNEPSAMRSAIEDLQTTLSTIRTQLEACTQLQGAAGRDMANMPGMVMPGAPTVTAPPSGTSAPDAAAAGEPRKMVMVVTATDPSKLPCSTNIDPKTAAKAVYKGTTYYFCSVKDRDEFLTDPEMSLSMMPPKK